MDIVIHGADVMTLAEDLERVYAAAFGAPGYDEPPAAAHRFACEQLPMHAERDGFRCAVAHTGIAQTGSVVGFAYGYTGRRGQWWSDHVAALVPAPIVEGWIGDHFEFVELAVDPAAQRLGIGRALASALVDGLPHNHAVLSTFPDDRAAPRLYRSLGWQRLAHIDADSDLYGLRLPRRDRQDRQV